MTTRKHVCVLCGETFPSLKKLLAHQVFARDAAHKPKVSR